MPAPVFTILNPLSDEAFESLEAGLTEAVDRGAHQVVLALDNLKALDTPVIRQLIKLLRRARELGAALPLSVSRADLVRTLQVTALDKICRLVSKAEVAA